MVGEQLDIHIQKTKSIPYSIPYMLLLSRFSRVRLCVTPWTAAHQAPPSLGFSSKNTGVACRFLLQCMKVKSESEVSQLCLTLRNPMDCSLPGSSIHGIFQARVLEWGPMAFSRCKELTHWKRPWCWERLRARGEEGSRGWDGWMESPTQWTWVWANSRR